jgi:hypothetical protein
MVSEPTTTTLVEPTTTTLVEPTTTTTLVEQITRFVEYAISDEENTTTSMDYSTTSPLLFVFNYSSKSQSNSNSNPEPESSSFNPSLIGAIVASVFVLVIGTVFFVRRQRTNSDEEADTPPQSPFYLEPVVNNNRDNISNPVYSDMEEYPAVYNKGDSMPHYEVPMKNIKVTNEPLYDLGTMNNESQYELASEETVHNESLYDLAS